MPLVSKSQLEGWYLVNPYIYDGYRSPRSPYRAFLSAFELHNETLTIYTHLLPGLYWLYKAFSCVHETYYDLSDPFTKGIIRFSYFAGAFLGLASAFRHIFHIVDYKWSDLTRKVDYTGIIIINLTHQILDTYILFSQYSIFKAVIVLEGMFAAFCIYYIIASDSPSHWRITYPAISSTVLTIPAIMSRASDLSVYSMQCSFFVLTAGGVFFKGRIPESLTNPNGLFNNFNSHVWHHIFIVAAVICAYKAIPALHLLHLA
jgi:adiponectin receptor